MLASCDLEQDEEYTRLLAEGILWGPWLIVQNFRAHQPVDVDLLHVLNLLNRLKAQALEWALYTEKIILWTEKDTGR